MKMECSNTAAERLHNEKQIGDLTDDDEQSARSDLEDAVLAESNRNKCSLILPHIENDLETLVAALNRYDMLGCRESLLQATDIVRRGRDEYVEHGVEDQLQRNRDERFCSDGEFGDGR